ncbi:MAG: tetraacyldisaccharide 4'-kinase [Rhodospirillaceae bacterium]|nr:tetraacyldisaccharide 4'-kinase [Rhodospirillaceae bacterium]|tara:strand:+ start:4729 stop:5706 length:978 start_codon:yes stop_codon:yes gene_type:complete
MKTPNFWQHNSLLALALQPAAELFRLSSLFRRYFSPTNNLGVPVICIGNLVSGGAGKTPTAISIGHLLTKRNKIAFLTRGYRGSLTGPIRVDIKRHTSIEVGDEALLLAEIAPTWIAKDRKAGGLAAKAAGAEVIILDDGFQNPSVHKDFSILAIDGPYGLGNGRLMPAGPLRETIKSGLSRTNAVVIIGPDKHLIGKQIPNHVPVLTASIKAQWPEGIGQGIKVLGFAGIGRPNKFLETLETFEPEIVDFAAFPDHHNFTIPEITKLQQKASDLGAQLVTTKKDYVRIPETNRSAITPIDISLIWDHEENLLTLLKRGLHHVDI